jgi:hypothetical protein
MHYFNDRARKVPKDIILAQYFEIMTKGKKIPVHRYIHVVTW